MSDRNVRNLEHLRRTASTARVLNLLNVAEEHGHTEEWAEKPMFQTAGLNRSLIIKHRLRRNELDLFPGRRQIATKVVIPIDSTDLKSGGRYVFVDQFGFERALHESFGLGHDHPDLQTLRLMDKLPSLDPFLLREQLRRGGVDAGACYFALSEADLDRMLSFVKQEIEPLVILSLGGDVTASSSIERMAAKILSNAPGDGMEVLGQTLRLQPEQYQEGVFCWKGFLYYKWSLNAMTADVASVADAVAKVKPTGPSDPAAREYIERGRHVLRSHILKTCVEVSRTLKVYDEAYEGLTREGNPLAFRDFLLEAPAMFSRLGDQLGAVQHIVSFWNFRFGPKSPPVGVDELIDIFMDFETGLMGRESSAVDPRDIAA
ncbi:hypothetical protein E4M02_05410 [Brevundimonas sp. S30B]|uniref:hypothetical protein n=1 Tax=unclassified Brevundimonas TaxID=2622653 RepID=UPI0010722CD2|nr:MULTISPECIES: hypothetical protein [unclassified Brevundimonas]QBX36701.1 hypothetical protein E4M01_02405 [Brevundimonas sp. MF30-B]TFW04504.1 hypothetical protein E4M02_05410 [Brevundimonas sp. S30B]